MTSDKLKNLDLGAHGSELASQTITTGGPEKLDPIEPDPVKATEPEKLTLRQFREPGVKGRLFIPPSRRRKGEQRHRGEGLLDMMFRMSN